MQSAQEKLDLTSPARTYPPQPPSSDGHPPPYTPRTVWQTPHGLPPNFTRYRSSRAPSVSKIMRRCLRLMYRLAPRSLPSTPAPVAAS